MATMKDLAALLGVELGEEFRISDSLWLYKFDDNGLMHKAKGGWRPFETENTLCDLFAGREEIVKLPWKPKDGDLYYKANDVDLNVELRTWKSSLQDFEAYAAGNCFMDKEDAVIHWQEVIDHLKSIYENGREKQSEKPSVEEAAKVIKGYCEGHDYSQCKF